MSRVTAADLEAFVHVFEASDWDEVDVRIGDVELYLSRSNGHVISRQSSMLVAVDESATAAPSARITAPHLATVHHGVTVGGAACVKPGDSVTPDTVVCTLQVMQRFLALKAGMSGTIRHVCVGDGALAHCGDVLFVVDAASVLPGSA